MSVTGQEPVLGLGSTMSNEMPLGRFPTYLDYGAITGARTFNVGDYWDEMAARGDKFGGEEDNSEVCNLRFLDRGYTPVLTSNPDDLVNRRPFFMKETKYLNGEK